MRRGSLQRCHTDIREEKGRKMRKTFANKEAWGSIVVKALHY